ncbi:Fpg/Nei family DNA glycosylase [Jiangella ureilytica]|uniref:DNA-(apurinic or apyrimidinic site) lyase n=1 Tax=Jiangella ureilytica TaxID=2530374 RepID=A0A4R4RCS7_9ACTN|nr:DNA-formamidopyrimidine glycosylase family protein [Jiangella ureilytica]TDC46944.1 Fpg/Nei family DNA glycosylase [Jiangella ureilytica]
MPEGDTVWLATRRLHDALAGDTLVRTDFRVPRLATTELSGRSVVESVSRGKHLLTRLSGGLTLHTHLRMDGAWRVFAAGQPWRGGPAFQIRVVLATARREAVGYRLPVVELVRTAEEDTVVGHLGPDLLGADWSADDAVERLARDPARTVGEALLDQRNLAGIGNMYMAELCFLAGVSPYAPVAAVPDLRAIVDDAHRLLHLGIETRLQSTTGDRRPGRQHWVYRRARRPCWRCGTAIRTGSIGAAPQDRIAFWCPRCQALPDSRES